MASVAMLGCAITALERHRPGRTGVCLGCLKRYRKVTLWPCAFARAAERTISLFERHLI